MVGKWIYNFLTKRTQCVVVDGKKSSEVEVISSVPQDDTKISLQISGEENNKELQRDIDKVFK